MTLNHFIKIQTLTFHHQSFICKKNGHFLSKIQFDSKGQTQFHATSIFDHGVFQKVIAVYGSNFHNQSLCIKLIFLKIFLLCWIVLLDSSL